MPPRRRSESARRPRVVRVVEAVGSSGRSWDGAVTDAVGNASEDAAEPIGVEVVRLWADLDGRKRLRTYRAAVKVAYRQPITPAKAGNAKKAAARRPGRAAVRRS